jgi:hypothetical protein
VSGIVFSALLALVLVLVTLAAPDHLLRAGSWLTDSQKRKWFGLALDLIPFAGIAFLWFIGVVRDRIGQLEDRFFATVFLGSGLLFLATLFVAAAIGGVATDRALAGAATTTGTTTIASARLVTGILIHDYALRMAGVFTISTATILHRTGTGPKWLALVGYLVAAALLFGIGVSPWIELVFPVWIGTLSLEILIRSFRQPAEESPPALPAPA